MTISRDVYDVYYYASPRSEHPYTEDSILDALREIDLRVVTNVDDPALFDVHHDVTQVVQRDGRTLFDLVDLVVLECSSQDPEISYLITRAAMQKKRILCLYRHGIERHSILDHLARQPSLDFLVVRSYTEHSIEKVLLQFIRSVKAGDWQDSIPSLKYTLRLSPRMEKYLQWICKKNRVTKAKYIRECIEQNMEEHPEYLQQHDPFL